VINFSFVKIVYSSFCERSLYSLEKIEKVLIFAATNKTQTMLNKLMGNLGPMKEAMDNSKKKLDAITVKGEVEGGLVTVYANGNRRITEININQKFMDDGDKEAIEELVQTAINKALEHADSVNETEMATTARSLMPGMF
jgi:hypothetical protein